MAKSSSGSCEAESGFSDSSPVPLYSVPAAEAETGRGDDVFCQDLPVLVRPTRARTEPVGVPRSEDDPKTPPHAAPHSMGPRLETYEPPPPQSSAAAEESSVASSSPPPASGGQSGACGGGPLLSPDAAAEANNRDSGAVDGGTADEEVTKSLGRLKVTGKIKMTESVEEIFYDFQGDPDHVREHSEQFMAQAEKARSGRRRSSQQPNTQPSVPGKSIVPILNIDTKPSNNK